MSNEVQNLPENLVLQDIMTHKSLPQRAEGGNTVAIYGIGEYRASTDFGHAHGLYGAGLRSEHIDHIVVCSTGVMAGIASVQNRTQKIMDQARCYTPSETLSWSYESVMGGRILQTRKLLASTLLDTGLDHEEEWTNRRVLPDDYQGPVIHVVVTKPDGTPEYIRSDEVDGKTFQEAIAATMGIPGFSRVERVGGEIRFDGGFSDSAMIEYARNTLGAKRLIVSMNDHGPYISDVPFPDVSRDFGTSVLQTMFRKYPFLVDLHIKKRPGDRDRQYRNLEAGVQSGDITAFMPNPHSFVTTHPALTVLGKVFYDNTLLAEKRVRHLAQVRDYQIPNLRKNSRSSLEDLARLAKMHLIYTGGHL